MHARLQVSVHVNCVAVIIWLTATIHRVYDDELHPHLSNTCIQITKLRICGLYEKRVIGEVF